jgi:hypothetical protein
MATYGSFETVAELNRGGLGSVWSARRSGTSGDPTYAIKLCEPDALIYGRDAAGSAVASFLEQAETQRKAAAAGDAWAPVHESGVQENGAYLATDLFNRSSVERLVSGRFRLDGPGLHRIISTVVRGLGDVRRACGRGHGNLKPTNVLIEGKPGVPISRVALSDPASDVKARAGGDAADLKALGALIYQCVLHQPYREVGAFPVPDSKEWQALGPAGKSWLALCNRLLDPRPEGASPTLEEVAASVEQAGRLRPRKPGPLIAAAAVVLLAGGIGGYYFVGSGGGGRHPVNPGTPDQPAWDERADEDWKAYCVAWRDWGGATISALDRPAGPELGGVRRRDLYATDPDLAAAIKELEAARAESAVDPLGLAGLSRGELTSLSAGAPDAVRTVRGMQRFRRVQALLVKFESLAGGDWARCRSLQETADRWQGRGWMTAAAAIRSAIEGLKPAAVRDATVYFDRVFATAAAVEAVGRTLDQAGELDRTLAGTQDAILKKFAEWVSAVGVPAAGDGPAALVDLNARLADAVATGSRLTAFLGAGWRNVDREYFAEQSPVYRDAGAPATKEMFERWLQEAGNPKYAVPSRADDPTDPSRNWRGETRLEEVRKQVAQLSSLNAPAPPEVLAEVERLAGQVSEVKGTEWNRRNVERKTAMAASVQSELDRVWGTLAAKIREETVGRAESAAAARQQLQLKTAVVPNSDAINRVWVGWRDAYVASITESNYNDVPPRALLAEKALVEFNEKLPAGLSLVDTSRGWSTGLSRVVQRERELRAGAALEAFRAAAPTDTGDMSSTLASAASAYGEWVHEVESLASGLAGLEDLLNAGYGLSEAAPGGQTVSQRFAAVSGIPVFREAEVAAEVRPVTERVAELERIAGLGTPVALAAVLGPQGANNPEAVVAAWRRLDEVPTWPSTLADLRQEQEFRRRFSVVTGLISDAARREALAAELGRGGVSRWTRAFAGMTSAADIEAVIGLMADFGVDRGVVTDPRQVYNLFVYDLKRSVTPRAGAAEPTDDQVLAAARPFLQGVQELGSAVTGQAKASPLLAELVPLVTGTEPPPPPFDANAIGPGKAGWSGQKVGESIDVLRYTLPGASTPTVLEFRRIEPTEGVPEPVYLCTTEVSVGVLLEVARATRALPALDPLLPSGVLKGPSSWTRAGGSLAPGTEWLETQAGRLRGRYADITATPPGLDAGRPSLESPVQQVSVKAALLACRLMGCRLPTPAEWRAAYARAGQGVPPGEWNLRDQTWMKQRDYVKQISEVRLRDDANKNVLEWPDAGVFWPVDMPVAQRRGVEGAAASARPEDDGVLWFLPVGSDTAHPFHHLVGNVAELVFPDPAATEGITATPEAVAGAVKAGADRFAVIGGSALSAPTIVPDQPQRVDPLDAEDPVGYSDVGFRPAFSARGTAARESYAARVARLLTNDPYLR